MYKCQSCGYRFEYAASVSERHGMDNPPYEKIAVCPRCKSTDFKEITIRYCRCCGARLSGKRREYCNEQCHELGRKLWEQERERRKFRGDSPLSRLIAETEAYNLANGTCYTYGQYVSRQNTEKNNGDEKNDRR